MSLALWEFFWTESDWTGASASASAADALAGAGSGGGGTIRNDDIFPRPDSEYWDIREGYLKSRFRRERKPSRVRTPSDAIKLRDEPLPPIVGTQSVPVQYNRANDPPSLDPAFQRSMTQTRIEIASTKSAQQIAELNAVRARIEGITAAIQKAQELQVETPTPRKVSPAARNAKLNAAKRTAKALLRALQRNSNLR